ncbi:hypothetical protein PR048_031069 [Dryococelus australis]|uniref:Uncharacterized protein n=1 Tax=Dryococelus australis TaxID=614101 RepID=A0ABQ9G491_9NEOP|nr:hypothetical protein PR048_031069 [Dryococelus australis]
MATEKPFMFEWNESVAKRSSSKVTSCILKYIELHFEPLKVGGIRRLVVWSDHCIAKNNNWQFIDQYHYLIFSSIDRDFALIERRTKKYTEYQPKQWLEVIVNASPAFSAYYMDKEDFIVLPGIEGMFKKQPDIKIASFHWIKFS